MLSRTVKALIQNITEDYGSMQLKTKLYGIGCMLQTTGSRKINEQETEVATTLQMTDSEKLEHDGNGC